ncbi:MAG: phosphoglucosamine mutase [Pirellulales bacterium]
MAGRTAVSGEPIITASGLRGVVGQTFTPEVAWRYAVAFAKILPAGPVVVSRDGRANGREFLAPVTAGLTHGDPRTVLDAGVAATPTVGVLVRQLRAAGGIQISASHNPAEYNGIKLFWADGRIVPDAIGQRVLANYRDVVGQAPATINPTVAEWIDDSVSAHLALIEDVIDLPRIRARRFRVVLDSNHGAGSTLGEVLLDQFGCDVNLLGGTPDGNFDHPPEPTAENLTCVLKEVTENHAQIGFCQDPDADRLAIVDENGRYLGEEYTLAMCADHVLRATPGPIVLNCSTSRMTEDVARRHDVPFHRSKVGEANVVDMMIDCDAVFGGEGNGGVIDPRVGLVRDSFVGMALVLDAMAARGVAVSELAAELPRYAIRKTKIDLPRDRVDAALDALEREFPKARADRLDGLRLDWGNPDGSGSWLLVRASNTEPIVRLVAEAPTGDGAERLCQEGERVIRAVQSS